MIGHLDGPRRRVVLAGELLREDRGEQILRAHALQLRRHLACRPAQRSSASDAVAFQRQRVSNIGACSAAWISSSSTPLGAQHLEHRLEREAVLRPEREHDAVVGGRGLQLEVEACGRSRLRSAMPQARLMRPPKGAWITSCMPPASSKKRSDHHASRGSAPRRAPPRRRRRSRAAARRRARSRPRLALEPGRRALGVVQAIGHALRAPRRPRPTARACAPAPRRARTGWWAARRPRPRRAPGRSRRGGCATSVAEQEHVARHRLDRRSPRRAMPIVRPLGLQHDVVVRVVGDRAARGERGQARAAPRRAAGASTPSRWSSAPRAARGRVAMPSASMSTTASKSSRASVGVRRRPAAERRRARPRPAPRTRRSPTICWARMSSGASRRLSRVDLAARAARTRAAHSTSWSRVSGKSRPLGVARRAWPERPTRCSAVAIERGEPIRQMRSTAPTSMPSSSDAVATTSAELALLEPLLGVEAPLRATGCRGGRRPRSAPRRSPRCARHALDQPPRVDEHQRRAVRARQLGDAVVDLLPLLVGARPRPARRRHLDGQVEVAALPDVDDLGQRPVRADQQPRRASGSAAPWPTGRCAAGARRARPPAPRAARATAPGARRACRRRPRGSRRRSPCARRASARRLDSAVSRMNSDSGVVTSTCGGRRAARRRSRAGVSPVRTAVRISGAGSPAACAASAPARRAAPPGCAGRRWRAP